MKSHQKSFLEANPENWKTNRHPKIRLRGEHAIFRSAEGTSTLNIIQGDLGPTGSVVGWPVPSVTSGLKIPAPSVATLKLSGPGALWVDWSDLSSEEKSPHSCQEWRLAQW